jgi:hypothetical protein
VRSRDVKKVVGSAKSFSLSPSLSLFGTLSVPLSLSPSPSSVPPPSPPPEDLADADATPTATDLGFLGASIESAPDPQREHLLSRDGSTASGGGGSAGGGGLSSAPSLDPELKDSLPPLPRERLSMRNIRTPRLMTTHSDDNDSAVSMSFDRTFEDHDLQREIERRMSGSFVSSGLFSLNMSETEKAVDVTIDPAASYGFAAALQYEGVFLVTEDYPPGEETIFRSGDRILAVGDTSVRGMSPDSFQELLEVCIHTQVSAHRVCKGVCIVYTLSVWW